MSETPMTDADFQRVLLSMNDDTPERRIEQLESALRGARAEVERLREQVEGAYREGWMDAVLEEGAEFFFDNMVRGWEKSETRRNLAAQPGEVKK